LKMGSMSEYKTLVRDRGNIKWTAMMLTEHKGQLKEWGLEQKDVDPPAHDEDFLAEMADVLSRSLIDQQAVQIKYWKSKRNHEITGTVKKIDPMLKSILIEIDDDNKKWIEARHIVRVDLMD